MSFGHLGYTEYDNRSDGFELEIGPEEDDNGLRLSALTPPPFDRDPEGSWDQEYVVHVRRASPSHAYLVEDLFRSGHLPINLPLIPSERELPVPERVDTPLASLGVRDRVSTRRISDDGTSLRAELHRDGFELVHCGPAEEKWQVALGLSLELAERLWDDYRNGKWLPVGKSVFPDVDPFGDEDHEHLRNES